MARELDNWIKAYLVYTAEQESPELFHKWNAISAIAAVLRRRVFFDMRYFLCYPNLYIVLVSPAGRCKKSTSMRIGRSTFKALPEIGFSPDSTTRERFIQDMQMANKDGESAITTHSTEFASLLSSSKMDMVVWLTDIYDCPPEWTHKTLTSGTKTIVGPYLNLLGATTPDWIAKAMPLDTIGIGLTSRIIFVFSDKPRKRAWRPAPTEAQSGLFDLLVRDLGDIASLNGEFQITPEADKYYDDWYQSRVENPNPTGDPRLSGYFERKPMHAIKLAMIVSASQRSDLTITKEDIQQSLGLLAEVEEPMPEVFANVGKNPLAMDYDAVLHALEVAGDKGLGMPDLIGMFKHSVRKDELAEVLDMLIDWRRVTLRDGRYYVIE